MLLSLILFTVLPFAFQSQSTLYSTVVQHHYISQSWGYCILSNKPKSRTRLAFLERSHSSPSHIVNWSKENKQNSAERCAYKFFLNICSIRTKIHKNIHVIKNNSNLEYWIEYNFLMWISVFDHFHIGLS